MSVAPETPCIVGVGQRTWHPDDVGADGAPEPLVMWEEVARAAADDSAAGPRLLEALDDVEVVYCQTWQYDDPVGRLADRLRAHPARRHYSGIGGTTPQILVQDAAARILAGEVGSVLVVGAEALATQVRVTKAGERYLASFAPEEQPPFPWEAPFHPAELAHALHGAYLAFALFDNARRAHLGVGLPEYRQQIAEMMAPMSTIAAANPNAWFRTARSADDILTARPDNRMVAYPYTKYMIAVMDVDMAAALVMTSHAEADRMHVPADRRVYLRGWCDAYDPVYVAEHPDLGRSPAMEAASAEALRVAGAGIDDVAHLDLYSCFGSSLNFARDALGLAPDDARPLTVTGGLPYHGGPASNYMTHSLATMVDVLRRDPGALGLVSGVGMSMTKHVFGCYSTEPGPLELPDRDAVTARVDAHGVAPVTEAHAGPASVATYSVLHGRDGAAESGLAVCDLPDGSRCYARFSDPELLAGAEAEELGGRTLHLEPVSVRLRDGRDGTRNDAHLP